jgi:peptidoglycan/xylan/chitin deacetylase (PgdA/CDA1 family)
MSHAACEKTTTMPCQPRVATVLYHEVTDDPSQSGFQNPSALPYKHTTDYFRQNLDVIAESGAQISTVYDIDFNSGGQYVMLTFDDGGKSAMQVADHLEERGWRGHFFITTEMIGAPRFVTADDLRDLRRRGHVVGSHSHTHPPVFWRLTEEEMIREWRTSCQALSAILQEPITAASVPCGEMDRRTADTAAQAGIKYLFTSEPTVHPWRQDGIICLGRFCPKRDTSLRAIGNYVRCRGLLKPLLIRWCKQTVKKMLGCFYHPSKTHN